jgi:hypothetical protein
MHHDFRSTFGSFERRRLGIAVAMETTFLLTPTPSPSNQENINPASLEHAASWRPGPPLKVSSAHPVPVISEVLPGKKLAFKKSEPYAKLLQDLQQAETENAALKKLMHHSGAFDAAGTEGLIKRRGAPVKDPSLRAARVRAAAATVLEMSLMVQGPDIAANIVALVKAATARDASVPAAIAREGMIPELMEEVTDKRCKTGKRTQLKKVCEKKTAWLWQAKTATKSGAIHEQRRMMGKGLVDSPDKLQQWAEEQPELPEIAFVQEGSSAMYVPPKQLLEKLRSNPKFEDTIRWQAPYDKQSDKLFMWYLVRPSLSSLYLARVDSTCCHVASHDKPGFVPLFKIIQMKSRLIIRF